MYKLPYISVDAEVLIPHVGSSYTVNLSPIEKDAALNTASFTYEDSGITIHDVFIVIPILKEQYEYLVDPDQKVIATLSVMDKSFVINDSLSIIFNAIQKVEILNIDEDYVYFNLIEYSFVEKEKEQVIKIIKYIKDDDNYPSLRKSLDLFFTNTFLDELINFLYPTLIEDYHFYVSKSSSFKIYIINSLLFKNIPQNKEPTINKTDYPELVFETLTKEKQRLSIIPKASNDYVTTLDYIELIEALPWKASTNKSVSFKDIVSELDKTHHGLDYIKEIISNHFAFEELTKSNAGSILLFLGPPGTGKTTIAKAIAKAMNREYISISLGGVSDESEIRGHRRTYVSARPGRLISALKKCKHNNPLILLDEIDKIKSDRGDPFAALLELLDTEQNNSFVDRFLEVPYDFSNAMFICTANTPGSIPEPLLDRLELITFRDYSSQDKEHILTEYVIPKLLSKYELETYNIIFDDNLLIKISKKYSLRTLQKIIFKLLKFASKEILLGCQEVFIDEKTYDRLRLPDIKRKVGF